MRDIWTTQFCGSGTMPACIEIFVFGPFILVLASARSGTPREDIVRYVNYASDKVVLDLYSSKVIKSVIKVNSGDVGNLIVVVVSIFALSVVRRQKEDEETR